MPTKQFKPVTAGTRFRSISDFSEVTHKGRPEKKLTEKIHSSGGRNHHGHVYGANVANVDGLAFRVCERVERMLIEWRHGRYIAVTVVTVG